MRNSTRNLLLALSLEGIILPTVVQAWTSSPTNRPRNPSLLTLYEGSGSIPDPVSTNLPRDESVWKTEGERIIMNAVIEKGAKAEDVDIQWKPGKIIVTLSGDIFVQAKVDEEDEDFSVLEYDEEINEDAVQEFENEFESSDDNGDDEEGEEEEEEGVNVVSVARAINYALGEDGEGSMAYNIAVHHSIEVTTPGANDELSGIMFESYRGFSVFVEVINPKKDKVQILEGKLVERNEKQTIVNVKGRVRKLKNELVLSVKLPKAKREKGVK